MPYCRAKGMVSRLAPSSERKESRIRSSRRPMTAPVSSAIQKQKALTLPASAVRFCPSRREISELPPCPKMLPKAINIMKMGAQMEMPAISAALPFCAIKYVSARL